MTKLNAYEIIIYPKICKDNIYGGYTKEYFNRIPTKKQLITAIKNSLVLYKKNAYKFDRINYHSKFIKLVINTIKELKSELPIPPKNCSSITKYLKGKLDCSHISITHIKINKVTK